MPSNVRTTLGSASFLLSVPSYRLSQVENLLRRILIGDECLALHGLDRCEHSFCPLFPTRCQNPVSGLPQGGKVDGHGPLVQRVIKHIAGGVNEIAHDIADTTKIKKFLMILLGDHVA